jgi:glycyl-tRNA synthetase beta chain
MKQRADFLLEVGCEEIPAGMIAHAARELKVILEKYLETEGLLDGGKIETFGAARRLAGVCAGLRRKQADTTREVMGPPKSVAFDNVGRPTRAAESFAAKQGVPVAKLEVVSTPRGEYLAAKQVIVGRAAKAILSELLPRAIGEIPWPKTMQWLGAAGPRFIRPIRWMVALLGGEVVPFELAAVKAGRESSGHRFLGGRRVAIGGTRDYAKRLKANGVLARPEERRRKISSEMERLARKAGLRVHRDDELLELVTYLNEYPSVILGHFEEKYLELPEEILITVMRDHQKYFAVERRDGQLAPRFLAVINLDKDRSGQVRLGHERVLASRFADAQFFWQTDQKRRLADYLPKLAHVTYESRLGSYRDKVERMRWLARWLAQQWFDAGIHQADVPAADRAAELAKCDLATEMVREFTELQGIVGGLYARAQEEEDEVAWAVYDQYKPAALEDAIPRNLTGCAVTMADRLDALTGCFAVGLVPSGSSDPFALRRAAMGIVKVILERKLPLSLSAAVSAGARALESYTPKKQVGAETQQQVLGFVLDRARYVFRERMGYAYDEVNAVLAAGADDLVDAEKRLQALKAIRKTKNFEPLAVAFKRIRKILEKAGPAETWRLPAVQAERLTEKAERELHETARRAAQDAGVHKRAGKYREALEVIAGLRPVVDQFFDDVLVMAEDEVVRRNRLTLLGELLQEFSTIADFSEIVAEEGR